MPALTLKNIPDDLYEKLKKTAQAHHRSLNSEVIHCLEAALEPRKLDAAEALRRARRLRAQISGGVISAAEIDDAIDRGRP